jgi:hypothetical protein
MSHDTPRPARSELDLDDRLDDGPEIDRVETGIRIALTLVFALIAAVIDTVLTALVAFELLWTLVTKRAPRPRVRELANRIVAWYYRIGRYLTYNDSRAPFPFADFPRPVEPPAFDPAARESEALGLRGWDAEGR